MASLVKLTLRLGVVVTTLLLTTIAARTETHYKPHISLGGHAGLAMSRISFSPEVPQTWILGPELGAQIRYAEEKIVGVMAELNITGRGWKESFEDNPDLKYSRSLYYLTLPIMTHVNFGNPRAKCFFNIGPEFGLMVASHTASNFDYKNPGDLLPSTRRFNQMSMKISNRFDYGITAGVGGEYYLEPKQSVYLEARFYFGLGNIYPATKADEFSASRSMSLTFNVGYNFRIY